MFRPRVIPCLLLKDKGLVKTISFKDPRYIGDPMNAVKIFNDLEADELVFLDIDASKNNGIISLDFVKKVSHEAFMPFAVGGGIKTVEDIKNLLKSGAEKVVINSGAIDNPNLIKSASDIFGSQSIIVSIDVKRNEEGKYEIYTIGGTKLTGQDLKTTIIKFESFGAGEILINSIDNDGQMKGYDLELIKYVSEVVNIPVVAIGGAGDYSDLAKVVQEGQATAAAAGSIFIYSGKEKGILINYPDSEELNEIFK